MGAAAATSSRLSTPLNFTKPGLEVTSVDHVHHATLITGAPAITVRSPEEQRTSDQDYPPIALVEGTLISDPASLGKPLRERPLPITRGSAPAHAAP